MLIYILNYLTSIRHKIILRYQQFFDSFEVLQKLYLYGNNNKITNYIFYYKMFIDVHRVFLKSNSIHQLIN
jgi:hypothetical protein